MDLHDAKNSAASFSYDYAACKRSLRASLAGGSQQNYIPKYSFTSIKKLRTATAGSDVVQSGRPIFDDFFQHLWPYIGNNTANVVFQMVKRLWLIRIDQ
ncbi:hypothetical protein TNCV_4339731 [Trichonephila clavipes]|nr:hypothetical protein TNCV_4339731 [Trichonephila clavipes]